MNDLKDFNVKEWIGDAKNYYENRYNKARALGIEKGSKFYGAFMEIEKRYVATAIALDYLDILPDVINKPSAEKSCKGIIIFIAEHLTLNEYIINEQGKKEYLPYKIKLRRNDLESITARENAMKSIEVIKKINFNKENKEEVMNEFLECLYYILNWFLMAREKEYPVITGKRKISA